MTKKIKLMSAIGVVVVAAGILLVVTQKPDTGDEQEKPVDARLLVAADSYQTNGNKNATVTVVEFADFQCPACAIAKPLVSELLSRFADDPKFNFVFRHFPLGQHKNAVIAAEAAGGGGGQGKIWEMELLLFEKQTEWDELSDPMPNLETYANSLGLNLDQFKSDLAAHKYRDKILRDGRDGEAAGGSSTPTFFINGKKCVGAPQH